MGPPRSTQRLASALTGSSLSTNTSSTQPEFLRRGRDSADTPTTAAARHQLDVIRREHRARGRDEDADISSTPTLS
jgi:hypothetical protein